MTPYWIVILIQKVISVLFDFLYIKKNEWILILKQFVLRLNSQEIVVLKWDLETAI